MVPETTREGRTAAERIAVRWPGVAHLATASVLRLPSGSRLRRTLLERAAHAAYEAWNRDDYRGAASAIGRPRDRGVSRPGGGVAGRLEGDLPRPRRLLPGHGGLGGCVAELARRGRGRGRGGAREGPHHWPSHRRGHVQRGRDRAMGRRALYVSPRQDPAR